MFECSVKRNYFLQYYVICCDIYCHFFVSTFALCTLLPLSSVKINYMINTILDIDKNTLYLNEYFSPLCPRTTWSQPSGDSVERLRPSSPSEVFSSNTVTWLPTRMPSSHLDTEMAFLSDKSIVYTLTLGAALTTKSAVPLPKGGAPLTCGATSTPNPSPAFPNWLPTTPVCPPSPSPSSNRVSDS